MAQKSDELPANIGRPASRALEAHGVTQLSQLAKWREDDLLALHGMGPKALRLLRDAMAAAGLTFAESRKR